MLTHLYLGRLVLLVLALFAVVGAIALWGQAVNGTISGTVTDPFLRRNSRSSGGGKKYSNASCSHRHDQRARTLCRAGTICWQLRRPRLPEAGQILTMATAMRQIQFALKTDFLDFLGWIECARIVRHGQQQHARSAATEG